MSDPGTERPPPMPPFREALRFWWKLGWISFGGPAGQIALMHQELVERRQWLSEGHFLHALNFCMLLPGPEAQQLATYLGWRLHGARGGIAAGVLFVLPAVFIMFGLSWLYVVGGSSAWVAGIFYGLMAAVIAVVATAVRRIGAKVLKSASLWAVAVAAFLAIFQYGVSFVIIVGGAAVVGVLGGKFFPRQFPLASGHGSTGGEERSVVVLPAGPSAGVKRTLVVVSSCLMLWGIPLLAVGLWRGWQGIHFQQGLFFSKAAVVTFGGAYAVLPYVSQMAVAKFGWLAPQQMMVGLGLAETTPGPLIMVLQFVGFVAAWQNPGDLPPLAAATLGALITTWVTFLPSFMLVFLGGPHVEGLRNQPQVAAALTAISAAVVGVILNLAIGFAKQALWPASGGFDGFVLGVALLAWWLLERRKLGMIPTLALCGLLGMIWKLTDF